MHGTRRSPSRRVTKSADLDFAIQVPTLFILVFI
jgi:hypothetical protein